jgi:hypothetical protein
MNQDYTDIIQQLSQILLQAIKEREFNLAQKVEKLDSELAKVLRLIGLQVISMLLNGLAQQATQEAKKPGLVVHRCPQAKYSVIFGTVEVSSPYLWHKKEGCLVYGLADGGNGLREALESEFSHFQFILDRPHLKQHLYATAEAMELTGQMRFLWLKYTLDLIDHGQVKRVISRLKHWQGKGQKTVLNFCNYLSRFRDALHYDKYRSLGLPIDSGEIESAHRYIPQKRLKIPGATWHPDTINPMLALRVIRVNDWWPDFWHQISLEKNQPISCC